MKCSNCGSENLEGKKFCGDCGGVLPQPPPPPPPPEPQSAQFPPSAYGPTQPRVRYTRGIFAAVTVLIIVIAGASLVFLGPFSKINVTVNNDTAASIQITITFGSAVKEVTILQSGTTYTGEGAVTFGAHTVGLTYSYVGDSHTVHLSDSVSVPLFGKAFTSFDAVRY